MPEHEPERSCGSERGGEQDHTTNHALLALAEPPGRLLDARCRLECRRQLGRWSGLQEQLTGFTQGALVRTRPMFLAHLFVNFQTRAVELDGRPVQLANKEFELLAYLLRHARELLSRETLLMMIWGYGPDVRTRTLDVHIRRLRQYLAPYDKIYIETVFSIGYRFQPYARRRAEPTQLLALEPSRTIA